ncbi:MAG: hypothetical protein FWE22_05565 [Firmicutes bacterium]|nr:hypothetical protein [Bacillota bacterium]
MRGEKTAILSASITGLLRFYGNTPSFSQLTAPQNLAMTSNETRFFLQFILIGISTALKLLHHQ